MHRKRRATIVHLNSREAREDGHHNRGEIGGEAMTMAGDGQLKTYQAAGNERCPRTIACSDRQTF